MARRTQISGTGGRQLSGTHGSNPVASLGTVGGLPNVQFERHELRQVLPLYNLVRDCVSGSAAVKKAARKYLPQPNGHDHSPENDERYAAYLERAVFYGVTRRTLLSLTGQIFLRDPQVDVPTSLDVLKLDANGENVTLEQIAMLLTMHALAYGRGGIFVDFPTTETGLTASQLDDGDFRPTMHAYQGRDIINWRKALRGARQVYTLIVIREDYTTNDDGFEAKTTQQYRVLRLVDPTKAQSQIVDGYGDLASTIFGDALQVAASSSSDIYQLEIWRNTAVQDTNTPGGVLATYDVALRYFPRGADGNFLNEIPFQFVGAVNNDDAVDHPPLADMAELNISHYRNSADNEESSFITGQPTPVVSGITQEWAETVLKGRIELGSRAVISLPVGGKAELLQADPNTMASDGMEKKERQMVALGAKLVEQRQVQRTATEAQMEGSADTSILANIAKNVAKAVEWGLKKACVFTGDDPDSVSFKLNTEFDLNRMESSERQQLLLEYEAGMIAFTEMRANLRRGGVATLDDKEALTAITAEQAQRDAAEIQKAQKINTSPVLPGTSNTAPQPKPGA